MQEFCLKAVQQFQSFAVICTGFHQLVSWCRSSVCLLVLISISVVNLQQNDGSVALLIGTVWTGLIHLGLGVLGTFVLKRFPTSFSVGFLLGVLVVMANQNLIMFGAFSAYSQGSVRTNHVFASLGFTLFAVLTFMSLLLLHFKNDVIITPMDVNDDEESPSK